MTHQWNFSLLEVGKYDEGCVLGFLCWWSSELELPEFFFALYVSYEEGLGIEFMGYDII